MLKRLFLMQLFLWAVTTAGFSQKSGDYLVSYTVKNKNGELTGYKNRHGKIIIPAQFIVVVTDKFYKMAIVLKNYKWVGIDRNQKEILKPVIYDNGPDYVEEGLFRFTEKNKMGFANLDGVKVISARFDFVEPFSNGLARYSIGGKKVFDKSGEHATWEGATGDGYVNRFGQNFSKAGELNKGYRKAWIKASNQQVLLNAKGKIVKYYN